MRGNFTLNQWLENMASEGKFFCISNLWKKQIRQLRAHGLIVEELKPVLVNGFQPDHSPAQFKCRISWENAEPEKSKELTQANRLYLVAKKVVDSDMESQ